LISAQFCVQRPSLRSRVLGLNPGMRPHSSSPQMTNAPISCEIRAPGQPSPRTAHRRTYTFDEILEMALWCHPPARKCYLRELLNLSSLAGLPRVLPPVTTLKLESLFADGNLRHQRWLWIPYHGFEIPRFTPTSSRGSKSGSAFSMWSGKLFSRAPARSKSQATRGSMFSGTLVRGTFFSRATKRAVKFAPDDAPWRPHSINAVPVEAMSFIRHRSGHLALGLELTLQNLHSPAETRPV
jgi:hypothetical protein